MCLNIINKIKLDLNEFTTTTKTTQMLGIDTQLKLKEFFQTVAESEL